MFTVGARPKRPANRHAAVFTHTICEREMREKARGQRRRWGRLKGSFPSRTLPTTGSKANDVARSTDDRDRRRSRRRERRSIKTQKHPLVPRPFKARAGREHHERENASSSRNAPCSSGEPRDQSALTRTSRLTVTACRSRSRGGDGASVSRRGVTRGDSRRGIFFVAGEMTRHCRECAVLRRARGASRTFLAAKDFFAPANWGGRRWRSDGLHDFRATGKCRAVRVLIWPRARSRCFHARRSKRPPRFRESSSPIRRRGFRFPRSFFARVRDSYSLATSISRLVGPETKSGISGFNKSRTRRRSSTIRA